MKLKTSLFLTSLIAGCGWNNMHHQHTVFVEAPLWDADGVVPAQDGLYVPLPLAGGLALVKPDGSYSLIDLGEGSLSRLSASPSGSTLIAIVDRYYCDVDDPKERRKIKRPNDCNSEDLTTLSTVEVIRSGAVNQTIDISGAYNSITFADDDRYAIAYLDLNDPNFVSQGVMDLTSIMVLDLEANTATAARVGFSANQVLFTYDEQDQASGAVILSQNSVAVVDLFADPPEVDVTFPLTLDPDSTVTPVGVELTPDGQYALISVANKSDLYALDLVNHSVNMVELSGVPAAMAVNTTTDQTLLVYTSNPTIDVLEHDYFDIVSYQVDESMNNILQGEDFAILYSTSTRHDLYHLDLTEEKVTEYRLQNPAISVHLAPTEDFVIALTRAESGYAEAFDALPGMEIIDLVNEKQLQFALEGAGLGVSFSATDTSLHALLLQQGTEYVYKYELYTGAAELIELTAAPVAIGTMPDGDFYITHIAGTGLITFLEPNSGETTEVGGFATLGIIDPIELMSNEEEE
jgi:hypothetical protein